MNTDLHMAEDLKNPGKCNLFVVFNEPVIDMLEETISKIRIKVIGVDSFDPIKGGGAGRRT